MRYFDLHCDTIYECFKKNVGLSGNGLQLDLLKAEALPYIQCCAAWVPDKMRGEEAFAHVANLASVLQEEEKKGSFVRIRNKEDLENARMGVIFTIEGGAAFGGKLQNIATAARMGVKMVTLTWNGSNEIGTGIGCENPEYGITDFGIKALDCMEKNCIIADVSHASEKLFYDVCKYSSKPFVASHSNAKRLCAHRRNLTDDQFEEIKKRGGLVGINFYKAFLNNDPDKACAEDIFEHADYFMGLGGESCLAMGSDFDGAELPSDMTGIEDIGTIYEIFLRHNYSEELTDKIFFKNAFNFMYKFY